MNFIGIDPGRSSGGIVSIDGGGNPSSWRMPQTAHDMWMLLHEIRHGDSSFAMLEKVHAMPLDSSKSAFAFGENYGMIQSTLACLEIPHDLVTPQAWQKHLNLNGKFASKRDRKNAHKAAAQRLFPGVKVIHANADALLIAEYGRRIRNITTA